MTDKPKRRWYQYSLRTLFVLMTLFAIACSWYAVEMQKAAKRRAAIAEITKLGGLVLYYDAATPSWGEPPGWFSWLRILHGDEQLGNAVSVIFFSSSSITDAGLVHLKDLTKLERLEIQCTQITDAGLEHLKGLTSLEWLGLHYTHQITHEGVENLHQALPNCLIVH